MAQPAATPLSTAFKSVMNQERLQFMIRDAVKDLTGYSIDRQDASDLRALMNRVFTNMAGDQYKDVQGQVARMNAQVVKEATQTISTGVAQHVKFLQEVNVQPVPLPVPLSTTTYGQKLPGNFKIGFS
jgi:Family of unknown function (DUF5761)